MTLNYEDAAFHQYCVRCGGDVIPLYDFVSRYNQQTGKPVKHTIFACVNWRWWNPGHFRDEFDENDKLVPDYDYL